MSAVYALFADPASAQAAVEELRAVGVSTADITVISSEPFEHHEFSQGRAILSLPLRKQDFRTAIFLSAAMASRFAVMMNCASLWMEMKASLLYFL